MMASQRVIVIGHTDVGSRVCALLQERGLNVTHLDDPTDVELQASLGDDVAGVAVLLHDDIRALRYCLAVEHLRPQIRLFAAIFDRTVRSQLETSVPNCVVMSPAAIAAPSMVAAAIAPSVAAVRRHTVPSVREWVTISKNAPHTIAEYKVPGSLRLRGLIGMLRGQGRAYDRGSAVLLTGFFGLTFITLIDTLIGARHEDFLVALRDAVLTTATIWTPEIGHEPARLLWSTGAAALVMMFAAAFGAGIVHHLLEGRHASIIGRRVTPRSGHVIVAGMGQVGIRLAQELREIGVAVVCIETRADAPTIPMAKGLRIPVIIDNAASRSALKRAGISRAIALVAAGSDERDNIAIAISALACAPNIEVVLRAGSDAAIDETRSLFHIGSTVDVNALTAAFVAQAMSGEHPYLTLRSGEDIVAIDNTGAVTAHYAAHTGRCTCN